MTPIQHCIAVDIQKHAKRQIVYMKQGDAMSRSLTISFYNDGAVWALPNEVTVLQLAYCKEDFVGGCYDHMPDNTAAFDINTSRTSATIKIHPQMLTVAGNVICELRLLNASAHVLNTFNFVINVEKSPIAMTSASEGYYNNVFDGATFTPHVSDAGILSWTNDKGLPNPDPIDLKDFVVSDDDIPVVPMEIATAATAVSDAESDDKLITPAGTQALIEMLLPAPVVVEQTDGFTALDFTPTARLWSKTTSCAVGDVVYRNVTADATTKAATVFYKCNTPYTQDGSGWSSHSSKFTELGSFIIPSLLNVTTYLPAVTAGTMRLNFWGGYILHQSRYSESGTTGVAEFRQLFKAGVVDIVIQFSTETGAVSKILCAVSGVT